MPCQRCGGSGDPYCAECERIRTALAGAVPHHGRAPMSLLMGPASNHWCHYCPNRAKTWDHVVPRGLGGPDQRENLVPSCAPCNITKADGRGSCRCLFCRDAWEKWGPV